MAIQVFTNSMPQVAAAWTGTSPGAPGTQTISGTLTTPSDLSIYTQEVGVETTADIKDGPTFGSGGFMLRYAGLKSGTVTFGFISDYAAAALDVILRTTLGGLGSSFYYDIKATNAARSATNPSHVGQALLAEYKPFPLQVGELAIIAYSFPLHGAFTTLVA